MKKTNKTIQPRETMSLKKAVAALMDGEKRKFVESVDLDIVLRLKESQKKESLKGSVVLPFQFGEEKKVIVLCDEKDAKKALAAGASKAGLEDLKEELMKGFSDFDILIATPSVMPKIVELGKVLGPKGLMPNPRNETITTDVEKAVKSFKSGKMNFKMESGQGVIRTKVANMNMKNEEIEENVITFVKAIANDARKFNANPFKKITISKTMGTGIKVDVNDIIANLK